MPELDNIHFNCDVIDSYNKAFNLVQSARSSGKTQTIAGKIRRAFEKDGAPSIIIRRRIVDITESYIIDFEFVLNKFNKGKKIKLYYKSGEIKSGIVNIYTSLQDLKEHERPFLRIIALNVQKARLKGGVLPNVRYILFDEFMIDVRHNEKWLEGEVDRFKELYTTYKRESNNLKCWFLGNAYSFYSPYHAWLKIKSTDVKMGCLITGTNFVYNLYQLKPELIEKLKADPLFDEDDEYEKYALYGVAVNDQRIQIVQNMPRNFKLFAVFKLSGTLIGIYNKSAQNDEKYDYWCQELKEWSQDNDRKALCFKLDDVDAGSYIPPNVILNTLWPIKKAMKLYKIAYKEAAVSYLLETLYTTLPNI